MAFNGQGAAGGAASGAAVGTAILPGWGTAIGAVGGGLVGGFTGGKRPSLPPLSFSPDSLKSYSFADINLARDNPAMYAELQKNSLLIKQAQDILNARSAGMTALEQRNMQQTMGNMSSRLASQGLIGDPIAEQTRADQENKIRQQAAENAYNQRSQMMGQLSSMNQGQIAGTQGALQSVMNVNLANRQASMDRDAAMAGRQMAGYQAGMDKYGQQQSLYGGLLNGGLGYLGNNYNMQQNMAAQQAQSDKQDALMRDIYINNPNGSRPSSMYSQPGYSMPQSSYANQTQTYNLGGYSFLNRGP